MNRWLIIMLLVISLISTFSLISYRWEISKATKQLERINQAKETNELLQSFGKKKELIHLLQQINQLLLTNKEEKQQVQQQSQQLKQEITNISHDLRTPLTSIKGFSELLEDEATLEQEQLDYLIIIQKKIDTLLSLVDAYYEIAKIESADEQLVVVRQSLEPLLSEILLAFYQDFTARNLKVNVFEVDSLEPVWTDTRSAQRIFMNIIQNALRYADSYFTIKFLDTKNHIILEASNDTRDFPIQEIDQIFERSVTLEQSRSSQQSGLGLYIVRKLAEKQGGKAEARLNGKQLTIAVYFSK